jgi:hypothetical protein
MTTETDNHEHADHDAPASGHGDKPRYDDLNTPVILLVGVISAIVTFLTIAFVQGLCYQWQNVYLRARQYDYVNGPIQELVDSQKQRLTGTAPDTISIEDSMKQVVADYGHKSAKPDDPTH